MPAARVVPSAIFARDRRGLTEQVVRGMETPPLADAEVAARDRAIPDQQSTAVKVRRELTTASPDRIYELGVTAAAIGMFTVGIEALRECVKRAPNHGAAWRKLAELLRLAKEDAEARDAEAAAERATATGDGWKPACRLPTARLKKSERRLRERLEGKPEAEIRRALRDHLLTNPLDAVAMWLLAELERGNGLTPLLLLERALDLYPDFIEAREEYAEVLAERCSHMAVAAQTKLLLAHAPRNEQYRQSHALAMVRIGNFEAAFEVLTGLLREYPDESDHWLLYAQTLRFMGRRHESVHAYRRCLELQPDLGGAWWGLADLKGDFITETDIAEMRAHLKGTTMESDSRMRMLYALGQALERAGDFAASFAAYEEAANLFRSMRRKGIGPSQSPDYLRKMKGVFSRENFAAKLTPAPTPTTSATPIFIVGMPRAGSTLVEQILASHSQVEGTRELSLIGEITRDLGASRMLVVRNAYPDCILDFTRDQLAALGIRYLADSRDYRKSVRPWFIDKRPWNWLEVGLIHLILPHARIIDIRREAMASCFAMYKQLLPEDANFSYDLDELGRYYNNYVAMMQHWQSVLPGRVHFMQYERLVNDTENEVRRLLDHCGLPFEEACLRFWETERAVATPSAEQVRRPVYRDALEQWRNFEPWLDRLKAALSERSGV